MSSINRHFNIFKIFLVLFFICAIDGRHHDYSRRKIMKFHRGIPEEIKDVPYYVQLIDKGTHQHKCGGVIIAKSWILTAAHCFWSLGLHNLGVVIGTDDKLKPTSSNDLKIHEVADIKIHENYNADTLMNDIALIELKDPLEFNDRQQPVEISSKPWLNEGDIVTSYGMGIINNRYDDPEKLESITVPVLNTQFCQEKYFPLGKELEITDGMFCAGSEEKHGCGGDSGGPAVQKGQLVGIMSWGISSGECEYPAPSVFTNVINYREWIQIHTDFEAAMSNSISDDSD